MSIERYLAYADAFERSYADDDWTRIEQYFTEDAVYAGEPEARGRAEVVAKLKSAVDGFDRNMDSRVLEMETPTMDGSTLQVRWQVTFSKADCPDLVITGTEVAEFQGDRIALLRDDFDPDAQSAMQAWMTEHGAGLG